MKIKFNKRIQRVLLVIAIMVTLIIPSITFSNAAFSPVDGDLYAIIYDGNNKALQTTKSGGWSKENALKATGNIYGNDDDIVLSDSAFHLYKKVNNGQDYYFLISNVNKSPVKSESGLQFVFNCDNMPNPAQEGYNNNYAIAFIEEGSSGKYKMKNGHGDFLKIASFEGVENILQKCNENDASLFTMKKVSKVAEDSLSIESVAKNSYYISYKDKQAGDKVNLVQGMTDTEKFYAKFTECAAADNYTNERAIQTVGLQAKNKTDLSIGGNKWVDGPTINVSFVDKVGGWESLEVIGNEDGTYSFKDSKFGKYVTVNHGNELIGGKDGPLTENEKFIIHTDLPPKVPTALSLTEVENDHIGLKWEIPKQSIFTAFELIRATNEDFTQGVKEISVQGNTYKDTDVVSGETYYYKVCTYSGKHGASTTLKSDYTEFVSARTLTGVRPAVPTGTRVEQISETQVKLSWDSAANATEYHIYEAESAYADFKITSAPKYTTTDTSLLININSKDKYSQYFKVRSSNDVASSAFCEERISLETSLFGKNVYFFAQTDKVTDVNKVLLDIFNKQNKYDKDDSKSAQFNEFRYSLYFKPGDYTALDCIPVGFYTQIAGLGKLPTDVKLNNIEVPAYLDGAHGALPGAGTYFDNTDGTWRNATCNFWRSCENLSIVGTGNATTQPDGNSKKDYFNWSVAQAAPLRRVYSKRKVSYDWSFGWASGGYTADCYFAQDAQTSSGQQYYTRNSVIKGSAFGCTLNNFLQGVEFDDQGKLVKPLQNGIGKTNWSENSQWSDVQTMTRIDETEKIKEKPFLYFEDGEYKIFTPALENGTAGTSWSSKEISGQSKDFIGEGKSYSLFDKYYVAKESDSATKINDELTNGKNIFFTPGVYKVEKPIQVNKENTVLLGTGMASIIPHNSDTAMRVADKEGITISGLIFDAGKSSKYLLQVMGGGDSIKTEMNPMVLQDLFFRVGGTTTELTKAENALEINADNVLSDHFWIWRADHGAGVAWDGNESSHGLIVNGDNVSCYALFNEHFQDYTTLWNGENGKTFFYQNETAYDPFDQESWMSHNGSVKGYASYKVSNNVKKHYAVGLGMYNVFIYAGGTSGKLGDSSNVSIELDNAMEVPNTKDVMIENACIQTFAKAEGMLQRINSVINGCGEAVASGIDSQHAVIGQGWARKYILNYSNGVSQTKIGGKNIVEYGIQPSDEGIAVDKADLLHLYNDNLKRNEDKYTSSSWSIFENALTQTKTVLNHSAATQSDVNGAYSNLKSAIVNLKVLSNSQNDSSQTGGQIFDTTTTNNKIKKDSYLSGGGNLYITEEDIVENVNNIGSTTVGDMDMPTSGNITQDRQSSSSSSMIMIVLSIVGGLALGTAGTFTYLNKKKIKL